MDTIKTRTLLTVLLTLASSITYANDAANRELDRNMQEMQKFHQSEQGRQQREAMRDKSHDFRYRVDPNTSVGVGYDRAPTVDVRRTF